MMLLKHCGDLHAWCRFPVRNVLAPSSLCTCAGLWAEPSWSFYHKEKWRGESKSQWSLRVFVTMSNYDIQRRQGSGWTRMFLQCRYWAENHSSCESNSASFRDTANAGVCPFLHSQLEPLPRQWPGFCELMACDAEKELWREQISL